jgi:WD40 repeat protein
MTSMLLLFHWLGLLAVMPLVLSQPDNAPKTSTPIIPSQKESAQTDGFGDSLPPGATLRIGTTRFRHGRDIDSMFFCPQGDILASVGGNRHSIRLWSSRTGKELRRFDRFNGNPNAAVFSPDGAILVLGERDGTIILREVRSGREIRRLVGQKGSISCVTFSADGKLLASAGRDPTFIIWDVANGNEIRRIQVPESSDSMTWSLAVAKDGKLLGCGGKNTDEYRFWHAEVLGCWEISTGKQLDKGKGPSHPINFAAFSLDLIGLFGRH